MLRAALTQTHTAGRKNETIQLLDDLAKQKYAAPYFFAGIHAGRSNPNFQDLLRRIGLPFRNATPA